MTDPELADRTYVEPLTPEFLAAIIERERPDAILPTVGGQTALNLAVDLAAAGVLDEVQRQADWRVDRGDQDGRGSPAVQGRDARRSASTCRRAAWRARLPEAIDLAQTLGFPLVIRPSFTLGGVGGGIAYNIEEFRELAERGLELSPVHEVLIEESVIGWKEFELEVMRDVADNFVVICSIENIDPMGVHTGDSITVAPILTLSDKEYQRMRDAARLHHPQGRRRDRRVEHPVRRQPGQRPDGRHRDEPARVAVVGAGLEGDRVSDREDRRQARARLSPRRDPERHHPRHAGLLRADHRLRRRQDPALELREVPAGRPDADDADEVGGRGDGDRPHLQGSVHEGRAVAGARAERAAVRAVEPRSTRRTMRRCGSGWRCRAIGGCGICSARSTAAGPSSRSTRSRRSIRGSCGSSPRSRRCAQAAAPAGLDALDSRTLRRLKRAGFGDAELALAAGRRARRRCASGASRTSSKPVYKRVDTCAAEFESFTPYLYSSYEPTCESNPNAPRQGRHPRQRPEPDRAGHRVRLLLLPRGLRAARGRARDGDDQLQPGDGVDRLRHRRSAVLPAAHVRRRDGGDRDRAVGRRRRVVPRAVRRPDAAEAGARAAARRRADSRHVARLDRPRRRSQALRGAAVGAGHHAAGQRHRDLARGSARRSRPRSGSRSSSGRRTCSAAAAWRSSTTWRRSIAT